MSDTRRIWSGLTLAFGSLLILVGPSIFPARGQEVVSITKVAWFSDRAGATAQPEGGFEVADTLDGTSTAALSLSVSSEDVTSLVLVLTEDGGLASQTGAIDVCRATGGFAPANPGASQDAPSADCDDAVSLERSDSAEWTGDILALVAGAPAGSVVDVALVPGEASTPVPLPTGFQITLSGADVLATGTVSQTSTTSTTAGDLEDLFLPPDPAPLPDVPDPGTGAGFDDTFDGDLAGPPPTEPGAPEPVSDAVSERTAEENALGPPTGSAIGGGSGDAKPWWRLLLLIPLSAGVGYASGPARTWIEERLGGGDVPEVDVTPSTA